MSMAGLSSVADLSSTVGQVNGGSSSIVWS